LEERGGDGRRWEENGQQVVTPSIIAAAAKR
jgi:hypothetical protein